MSDACAAEDAGTLVSTAWLAERLGTSGLKVMDASWYLPTAGRDAQYEFTREHIPGARFFDIDAISDTASPLPHMLPAPAQFAEQVGALGIGNDDQIVVYDGTGIFSAARVWWMFRAMGHDAIAVLDGGLPKWREEGRPLAHEMPEAAPRTFVPLPRSGFVADLDDMRRVVDDGRAAIVDARPADRFTGKVGEPRPGLRRGHMPGAYNVPSTELLNPDGTMKPPSDLSALLAARRVPLDGPVITSCGSGVTAAVVSLALARLGVGATALYDGSWAEWGGRSDTPVES